MDTLIHIPTTTSTSDELLRLLSDSSIEVQEGTLVYADEQTKGRGQVGNSWESECGKNLTCSIVLFPDFLPADQQFIITQAGALAVFDFLTQYCSLNEVSIKWPNDIYWKDKKICGTLNEAMLMGKSISYVIMGVGINLNQTKFVSDAPNPVSVVQITGNEMPIDKAAVLFRQCVMQRYMQLVNGDVEQLRADYMDHLYRKQGFYTYEDESGNRFEAEIDAIAPDGVLSLKLKVGNIRKFLFKQVKFIR